MSDSDSDLTIDIKKDDLLQEKDYSFPSTSSENKSGCIEKYESKDLAEEMDSSVSENNEDSDSELGEHCAICLSIIRGKIGSPDAEGCEHYFCLLCILEWTKNNPTCPQDRRPFKRILVREDICGEVVSTIDAKSKVEEEEQEPADLTFCEVCGSCEREDSLLLCDGCDLGFHLDCLSPPLMHVPIEEWFCPLCVATDLPEVVKEAKAQKKNEIEIKGEIKGQNQKKKKRKPKQKPRMIPRTGASERVLRRINKTRHKESKKEGMDDEKEKKSKRVVQLFNKAKLYGSIADSDIDAAFNYDEYADMLLSSSSSSLSKVEKRDVALKTVTDTHSNPLPSYSGRSSHPKLENCQTLNTDLLINILEEQDILLSKTTDVSLTKERKLIKKAGAKSIDYNIDRENRVMSELLPSQKKAIESKEKLEKLEKENSHSRDSKHKKSEEKYKSSKDNFSNGHSSNYRSSHSSPRKSRERDSHSSYKSSKSYRNYDKKFDRRYDKDYRKRDSRRHRERSRSRERKDYSNHSGDYYDRRRSHRSRSKSRDRRRTERKHYRRSRTPERHKSKERSHRDKLPASSFWGKEYVDTFTDFDSKNNFDSYNDNASLHTAEISHTPQRVDVNLYDASSKTEEVPVKKVNNFNEEEGLSSEICTIPESIDDKNTFYKSEYKDKLELPDFQSKCDNKNNSIEEKRKLDESDYCPKIETEAKKRRLKNLFGEEGSDQDSPIHPLIKLDSISHSNDSTKEIMNDLLPKESRQNLGLESDSFQNSKEEFRDDHKHDILSINLPPPICLTSPLHSCENEQDSLGDITTLSKSSRDFILNSLFGNRQTGSPNNSFSSPSKIESKNSTIDSSIYSETYDDEVKHDKQKNKINDKSTNNISEKITSKESSESLSVEIKNTPNNKISEMFANLFEEFGNHQTQSHGNCSPTSLKMDSSKDNTLESTIYFETHKAAEHEKQKNKIKDKTTNNISEKLSSKENSESLSFEIKKTPNNKTNKMFANLFGDSSDSEASNPALDKNSKSSTINKVSKEISEHHKAANIKNLQNSSEPKLLPQKDVIDEKPNQIIASAIEKDKPDKPNNEGNIYNAIEKKDKPNNEGTQVIDTKFSSLPTKVKVNKLHLEIKVVDETKKCLNPFYLEKGFSKQMYKTIVSKCVNKVLEVESGNTVDPKKIQRLVAGYVEYYMHRNKKNVSNSGSSAPPPKSTV